MAPVSLFVAGQRCEKEEPGKEKKKEKSESKNGGESSLTVKRQADGNSITVKNGGQKGKRNSFIRQTVRINTHGRLTSWTAVVAPAYCVYRNALLKDPLAV